MSSRRRPTCTRSRASTRCCAPRLRMAGCRSPASWKAWWPSSAPAPTASSPTSRSRPLRRFRERKGLEEALGGLVADHAQARDLAALRIEEDDSGRPEKRKALEQRFVLGAVCGDVDLEQEHLVELGAH